MVRGRGREEGRSGKEKREIKEYGQRRRESEIEKEIQTAAREERNKERARERKKYT